MLNSIELIKIILLLSAIEPYWVLFSVSIQCCSMCCYCEYYNYKLGSGCNLDKDLSKSRRYNQLVKCKDTGLYLLLYIPNDYEE